MWDVDDSGCINLNEMTNIIATMDDVEGVEQEAKVMSRVVDIKIFVDNVPGKYLTSFGPRSLGRCCPG